jgi:hypothetical protein
MVGNRTTGAASVLRNALAPFGGVKLFARPERSCVLFD